MTENKRFKYNVNKNSIEYNDKHFAYCNGQQGKIAEKLNELHDKNITLKKDNETLKIKNKNLIKISSYTQVKNDSLKKENEQLKKALSDIDGQLLMLDNCDNWDYDRMKHTVREIAEIIGYNGTINPKR